MAYAFNRLNNALDKTNIFEGRNTDSTAESSGLSQPGNESQPLAAATVPSSGSPIMRSQINRPTGASKVDQGVGPAATQVAISEAQKIGVKIPGTFGRLTQSLDQQKTDMQSAADAYRKNQQDLARTASAVSEPQLVEAAEGNVESYNRVNRAANNPEVRNPDNIPLPSSSDLARNTEEARSVLGGDASLREALARGKGPDYTPEMAKFDVAAIKGNPGFSRTLSSLGESYSQLNQLADKLRKEYPELAKKDAEAIANKEKEGVRKRLGQITSFYDTKNQEEANAKNAEETAAFNRYVESLKSGKDQGLIRDVDDLKESLLRELKEKYAGTGEEEQDFRDQNLLPYLSPGDIEYTPHKLFEYTRSQMYDPTEAAKFNRLSGILGNGEIRNVGDYQRPISEYSGSPDQYKLNRDNLKNRALYTVKQRHALAEPRRLGEAIVSGHSSPEERDRISSTVADGMRAFGGGIGSNYDITRRSPGVMMAMDKIGLGNMAGKSMGELIPELIKRFDPNLSLLKKYVPSDNRWASGLVATDDAQASALRALAGNFGESPDYGTMTSENLFRNGNESFDVAKRRVRDYFSDLADTLMSELRKNGA